MNESYPYLTRFSVLILILFFFSIDSKAQESYQSFTFVPTNFTYSIQDSSLKPVYPDPKAVLRRSLIVPGWGQITNKQAWKVPIIYGLLGGLVYYSFYLDGLYKDYRAAYYNLFNDDFRFGATPNYLSGADQNFLQSNRDSFRNRRDLSYLYIGLAYLLNVVDAYVYAHMRSFDVSDDLSLSPSLKPEMLPSGEFVVSPTVSFKISLTR